MTGPVAADAILRGQVPLRAGAVGKAVFAAARRGFDAGCTDTREQVEGGAKRQLADDEGAELVVEFRAAVIFDAERAFAFDSDVRGRD